MARILFLCETHVARCLVLGEALLPNHEVIFALAPESHHIVPPKDFRIEDLSSIPNAQVARAIRRGRPIYDEATLARYVDDDLRLIDKVRPDLVVGAFRLSLSVSARLRRIPSLAVTNAYWSPWYERPPPLPALGWTKWAPVGLGEAMFALARQSILARHAEPLNRIRARHGLPHLVGDLPHVYCDADFVAYADVPEIFPTPGMPATHRHIGPVLSSPHVPIPAWCDKGGAAPTAYVALGRSGSVATLDAIVGALDSLGVEAWVATQGLRFTPRSGSRARVAPHLPGIEAAARADMVICNGNSLKTQQALAAGKPLLGIASNMGQFLNMRPLVEFGAARLLRSDRVSARAIRSAAGALLARPGYAMQAGRLAGLLSAYSAAGEFRSMVSGVIGASQKGTGSARADSKQTGPTIAPRIRPIRAVEVSFEH